MPKWLQLCFSKDVMHRAVWTALLVGAILVGINYGDTILTGQVDGARLLRIGLTVLVPYIVSTVSSVLTIFSMEKKAGIGR
jgi:hypothetical protein